MMRTVTEEALCFIRFMALSFMKSYVLFLKIGLIRLNEGTCKIIRFEVEEEMVLALLVSIVDVQLSVSCNVQLCVLLCFCVCASVCAPSNFCSAICSYMYTTTTTLLHHYSFT